MGRRRGGTREKHKEGRVGGAMNAQLKFPSHERERESRRRRRKNFPPYSLMHARTRELGER